MPAAACYRPARHIYAKNTKNIHLLNSAAEHEHPQNETNFIEECRRVQGEPESFGRG